MGKTRLTGELAASAGRGETLALVGHAIEGATTPFLPFIEILERLERSLAPADLRDLLGDAAPSAAMLVPELQRHFADAREPGALPAEQERRELLNGLCDVLARASRRQPLTLEDLHWAGESTLAPLQHLTTAPDGLTKRELGVLRRVAQGRNKDLAENLVISPASVARQVSNISHKTGLSNRGELVAYAYERGLAEGGSESA